MRKYIYILSYIFTISSTLHFFLQIRVTIYRSGLRFRVRVRVRVGTPSSVSVIWRCRCSCAKTVWKKPFCSRKKQNQYAKESKKPRESKNTLMVMFVFLDPNMPEVKRPISKKYKLSEEEQNKTTLTLHFNPDFLSLIILAILSAAQM